MQGIEFACPQPGSAGEPGRSGTSGFEHFHDGLGADVEYQEALRSWEAFTEEEQTTNWN